MRLFPNIVLNHEGNMPFVNDGGRENDRLRRGVAASEVEVADTG